MTFRVRLTAEAQANQNEIADWIAERSIDGALKWLDSFQRTTQQLALRPDAFSPAPENEFCDRELRNAFFGTRKGRVFRAVFYVEDEVVIITHLRGPHQRILSKEEIDNS